MWTQYVPSMMVTCYILCIVQMSVRCWRVLSLPLVLQCAINKVFLHIPITLHRAAYEPSQGIFSYLTITYLQSSVYWDYIHACIYVYHCKNKIVTITHQLVCCLSHNCGKLLIITTACGVQIKHVYTIFIHIFHQF